MAVSRLGTNIEIRISCKNLPNLDFLSKSDPFALVFVKDVQRLSTPSTLAAQASSSSPSSNGGSDWREVGKTEIIYNNNNPSFSTAIELPYIFEEVQPIKIVLWDYDSHTSHDYIGEFETTIGRLMGSRGSTLVGTLKHSKNNSDRGTIYLSGTEIKNYNKDFFSVTFQGHKLEKKDWFGSSDPYLTISRPNLSEFLTWLTTHPASATIDQSIFTGSRQRVWTGPELKNTLEPRWPSVEIPLTVCGYDPTNIPIIIECWDYNKREAHELIGEVGPISVQELMDQTKRASVLGTHQYNLINPAKQAKQGARYNNSGYLTIENMSILHPASILEYIVGGCQMNLIVAIDFTGSNGDPQNDDSLHRIDPRPNAPLNQYASAIYHVGAILQEYDSDKQFPAYGFGGTIDGGKSTNHCFPLNLDMGVGARPEIYTVQGLLNAYSVALTKVGLSGPTLYAPVIRQAIKLATAGGLPTQANQRYSTLLLLTDGQMNDKDDTICAIVEAANNNVPLSIIIVGIGKASFTEMEVLDGDGENGLVNVHGQRAIRDIVQFVPFHKFADRRDGGAALAAEVLAELPTQLCGYFCTLNIVPNPRPPVDPTTMMYPSNNNIPPLYPTIGSSSSSIPMNSSSSSSSNTGIHVHIPPTSQATVIINH